MTSPQPSPKSRGRPNAKFYKYMSKIKTQTVSKQEDWEAFLEEHPEANFLQSWIFGEFYKCLRHTTIKIGFYRETKLTGIMLCVVENAKRGRYLTIAGGPVLDWDDKELVDAAFLEMRKIAKENKCVFVRIRPQLLSDNASKLIFREHGGRNAPMYLSAELTSQLDITLPEEELLKNMRKTTRYEIKKAINLKIKIEQCNPPVGGEKLIKNFYDLQLETAKRQKFVPFSYKFFHEQFKIFFESDNALLYSAELDGKVLAQAFIIFYGTEAVYHYGVSTDEGRKYPGAYLIQWEAIKEAKKRGMTRYNFWGVAPETNKDHRFHGISIFKRGFGGADVQYLHAQDLVIDYPRYAVNFFIESIRKIIRKV